MKWRSLQFFNFALAAAIFTSGCAKATRPPLASSGNDQLAPGVDAVAFALTCPTGSATSTNSTVVERDEPISLNASCAQIPGTFPPVTAGTPGIDDSRFHLQPGHAIGPLRFTPDCVRRLLTIEFSPGSPPVVAPFAADGTFTIPNIRALAPLTDDKQGHANCTAAIIGSLRGAITCPNLPQGTNPLLPQNALIQLTIDWRFENNGVLSTPSVPFPGIPIPSTAPVPAVDPASQQLCTINSTCQTTQVLSLSCGR